MSDIATMRDQGRRLEQTQVVERPMIYLPWSQRVVNPFPLASSGAFAWGDQAQPWAVSLLAFYCSVRVQTTNNGTNFWTVALQDDAGNTLASFTTAAIAAATNVRFAVTGGSITQPGSTNTRLVILPTATLSPGAIFIAPAVALLRTGN